MPTKLGWYKKNLKTYAYKGKTVTAVNKPEAAIKLGVTTYSEIDKIRKVKK